MSAKRSNRWTPIVSLVVMASLIVIGNLRAPVSAAVTKESCVEVAEVDAAPNHGSLGLGPSAAGQAGANASSLGPMVGADVDEPAGEDGVLVPALYAWNPDVRFIYFRQVSKWM